jgi:hypothetical protein
MKQNLRLTSFFHALDFGISGFCVKMSKLARRNERQSRRYYQADVSFCRYFNSLSCLFASLHLSYESLVTGV